MEKVKFNERVRKVAFLKPENAEALNEFVYDNRLEGHSEVLDMLIEKYITPKQEKKK